MSNVSEKELIERATGKRVTYEALQGNIKEAHFFRAHDAAGVTDESHPLAVLTFCVLVLQNGFTVVGQAACADPTNYKQDIGERLAREDAEKKIWALMGYNLKQEIYLETPVEGTFLDRMKHESKDLSNKLINLSNFISGNVVFKTLDEDSQKMLRDQQEAMIQYLKILNERIIIADSK